MCGCFYLCPAVVVQLHNYMSSSGLSVGDRMHVLLAARKLVMQPLGAVLTTQGFCKQRPLMLLIPGARSGQVDALTAPRSQLWPDSHVECDKPKQMLVLMLDDRLRLFLRTSHA